ncbi:MAG: hypothetical protein ACRDPE_15770 [Solirubrobacterales bacterium]
MASRREHEGRVPQPGVPSGPRNTPKQAKRAEVAGPYRSDSADPSVRAEATAHEHRKAATTAAGAEREQAAAKKKYRTAKRIPAKEQKPADLVRAERAAKASRRKEREEKAATAAAEFAAHNPLKEAEVPKSPALVLDEAKQGKSPDVNEKMYHPRTFKKAQKVAVEALSAKEGIKADPIAELAIDTAATAGLGLGAKAIGTAAEEGAAKLLAGSAEKVASKEATVGSVAAEKAVAGGRGIAARVASKGGIKARATAERVRTAPERNIAKAKAAPQKAKRAATTAEGRQEATRATLKAAKHHPARTGYLGAVASPVPLPGELDKRARAFATGTADALIKHPAKTLETTAHAGLGFLTSPLALGGAAVESATKGSPAPLVEEGKALGEGTLDIAKKLASGDPKQVEKTTLTETGLTPFIPVPHILRRAKNSEHYLDARAGVRGKVEDARAKTRDQKIAAEMTARESGEFIPRKKAKKIKQPVADTRRPGEHYVSRKAGKVIEKQRSRHYVAREVSRIENEGRIAGKRTSENVAKPLRRSKGTDQSQQNDADALRIFVKHGLPSDEKAALAYVKRLHDNWPKIKYGDTPQGIHLDRDSTKYILDHPEIFRGNRGKKFFAAVKEFDKQAKTVGTSPRNQYLAQVDNLINPILKDEGKAPILKPEEMITPQASQYLPKRAKQWTRSEALDYVKAREARIGELRKAADAAEKQAAVKRVELKQRELAERVRQRKSGAKTLVTDRPLRSDLPASGDKVVRPAVKKSGPNAGAPRLKTSAALERGRGALIDADSQARGYRAEVAKLEREQKGYLESTKHLMKPPEHGGAEGGVSTTQAVAWTPEQEAHFVARAQTEARRLGLRDPAAYVADRLPSSIKGDRLPNFGGSIPLRKIWPSRGIAATSGNAESSFESLIHHSIEAPRSRAAMVRGLSRIFDKASRQADGKRFLTSRELERAINTHKVPDGVVPIRPQMLKGLLEGDNAMDAAGYKEALNAELEHGQELVSSNGDQLRGEVEASKAAKQKGEKYALMDAVAMHELIGHMEGVGGVTTMMGHASNFATRTILNSPAFEASQFAQEGIPMAAALGRNIVNLPRAIQTIREINKLPPEDQAQIRAVVGSSAGLLGSPSLKALRSDGYLDPIRAAGRKPAWRHAWELVNGDKLSGFDKERAGRFREAAAFAKLEGDFRRADKGFNLWRKGTNNLFKHEQAAVDAMHGMTPQERALYVTSHPRLADQLQQDMNAIGGNWNSYTVFEKHIAPFAIFYPFQRYSVLWTLYHFPLDHPVVATALATLGAVNANELRKLAARTGSEPNVLDYTKPVINGHVLPSGQRFFPGLASIQQGALEDKPAQALGTLSPVLSIPVEALTGKNSYTGTDIGENGWLYTARQAASLSPFLRFIGAPELGQSKSAASKVFGENDPLRTQRSLFDPYIGQTGDQYANEKLTERKYDEKYGPGRLPSVFENKLVQELLYGDGGKPKPEILPEVLKAIHSNEEAKNFVKRKEAKYRGPEKPFTKQQEHLLEEVENSWQTGPNATESESNPFGIEGSSEKLKESFGIPSTSTKELKEQFGIE